MQCLTYLKTTLKANTPRMVCLTLPTFLKKSMPLSANYLWRNIIRNPYCCKKYARFYKIKWMEEYSLGLAMENEVDLLIRRRIPRKFWRQLTKLSQLSNFILNFPRAMLVCAHHSFIWQSWETSRLSPRYKKSNHI